MYMQQRSSTTADPGPVIALHCSGAGAGQWRQLGDVLDARYELVAPKHYGCDSVGLWSGEHAFTLADVVARTIGIIDCSDCKLHLVGHPTVGSAVGLKVDFDMALLVIASGLYRMLAQRMRGYAEAQVRHIFRDLVDTPADVSISEREVHVPFHRRAHLPIIIASGILNAPVRVTWCVKHCA